MSRDGKDGMKKTEKKRSVLAAFLIMVAAVVLDQATKVWVLHAIMPGESREVLPGILHFTYVENTGAAFGMLKDHRWVFLVVSTVAILAIAAYLLIARPESRLEQLALAFIAGGGVGNMIDRVGRGYVIDFIDVRFVQFYVFNVADSFVCVGCGLMILWLILDECRVRRQKRAAATSLADAGEENHDR